MCAVRVRAERAGASARRGCACRCEGPRRPGSALRSVQETVGGGGEGGCRRPLPGAHAALGAEGAGAVRGKERPPRAPGAAGGEGAAARRAEGRGGAVADAPGGGRVGRAAAAAAAAGNPGQAGRRPVGPSRPAGVGSVRDREERPHLSAGTAGRCPRPLPKLGRESWGSLRREPFPERPARPPPVGAKRLLALHKEPPGKRSLPDRSRYLPLQPFREVSFFYCPPPPRLYTAAFCAGAGWLRRGAGSEAAVISLCKGRVVRDQT